MLAVLLSIPKISFNSNIVLFNYTYRSTKKIIAYKKFLFVVFVFECAVFISESSISILNILLDFALVRLRENGLN